MSLRRHNRIVKSSKFRRRVELFLFGFVSWVVVLTDVGECCNGELRLGGCVCVAGELARRFPESCSLAIGRHSVMS